MKLGAFALFMLALLARDCQVASSTSSNSSQALPPQYYINFGRCGHPLQLQRYGNWVMTRPLSKQVGPGSMLFYLDTKNMTPVAEAFGTVVPQDFPMRHMYFAYFNNSGIKAWTPALDRTPYKETNSYYSIKVNDKPLLTIRDLKDSGTLTPTNSVYSLKGTLKGLIAPSSNLYKIEIVKTCKGSTAACAMVPDPATVFTAPTGHIAFSFWNVGQALIVNGRVVKDHAWCPVQTVVDVA